MKLLPVAAAGLLGGHVWAAVVEGTLTLPPGFAADTVTTPSLWLLENGVVPIAPPLDDPRGDMVVVLEGGPTGKAEPTSVTVALRDVRMVPRVVPLVAGSSVDFRNEDRMIHELHATGPVPMTERPQAPGAIRTQKFGRPGLYAIRCKEVPHLRGTVLALETGRFAVPRVRGAFRFEAVPPGSYRLRVWYAGSFFHDQPLEVVGENVAVEVKLPLRPAGR